MSNMYYSEENGLREKLKKCGVFLPGRIVGQQAIYTIWENIIMNVKHCKKNEDDYIPFHIKIEEEQELYKITNWIDLDQKDKEKDLSTVPNNMENWGGILKDGKPTMGGTSQSILCAGMLQEKDFVEIEECQKSKEKIMEFAIIPEDNSKSSRIGFIFKLWKGEDIGEWKNVKTLQM